MEVLLTKVIAKRNKVRSWLRILFGYQKVKDILLIFLKEKWRQFREAKMEHAAGQFQKHWFSF